MFVHERYAEKIKISVKRGGGVGLFLKEATNAQVLDSPETRSFENIVVSSQLDIGTFNIVSIYRPQDFSFTSFLSEFQELLTFLVSHPLDFMIGGDFNITKADDIAQFNEIMEIFGLKQHVNFPSRCTNNNILDFFITSKENQLVQSVKCSEKLSDHFFILIHLVAPGKKELELPKVINYSPF